MSPNQSHPRTWPQYVKTIFDIMSCQSCDFISFVANIIWCVCLSQRENVEGVSQPPNDDVIRELSRSLRQALGVSLFGIDVIINNQTGQHAVIDINAFPGRCSLPSLGAVCICFTILFVFCHCFWCHHLKYQRCHCATWMLSLCCLGNCEVYSVGMDASAIYPILWIN